MSSSILSMPNGSRPVPASARQSDVWSLFQRFAPYLRGCRGLVAITLSLVLIAPLLGGATLWLLKSVIDDVLVGGRIDLLFVFAGLYGCVAGFSALVEYGQTRLEAAVVERLILDVRRDLYGHLLRLSPGSLRDRSAGDLIAHLDGDVSRLESLIYSAVLSVLDDLASVLFYLVFLLILSWKLTLLSLLAVPLLVLAAVRYAPRVRRAHRVTRRRASAWMSMAETTLNALPVVQAFAGERQEDARFAAAADRTRQAELHAVSIQAILSLLIDAAASIGTLLLVVVGALELRAGNLTLVVTSRPVLLFDRSLFLAHGCDPRRFDAVVVKSPHCQPQFFDAWASANLNVDAAGSTSANLPRLGHRKCARPVFPLEPDTVFEARVERFA